ncbi:hypothetical protein IX38_10645 [Chryseobacterium luteum]|uniref:RHS repeat-associated core domain-containing protein n=2 Tax=Chryseobacterium luteum TaxID=421531 RepID=A0A085ZHE4_9FLAO|nr:hypothetical protein IX38_10645 [Chryseobacterium luteum]
MNHLKTGNSFFAQGSYKSYKFLGNELQETGFYDMNARFYMADLGIFGQHDPLSASTLDPYGYAYNNPLFYTDASGLSGDPVNGGGGPDIPASSLGGSNNPYQIPEIVINAPIRAMASNPASIMPSYCSVCYSGNGTSSGINLPKLPSQEEAMSRLKQPILHNGAAQMIGGIGDPAGILDIGAQLLSNLEPEDQEASLGLAAIAIILTRGKAAPGIIRAESKIIVGNGGNYVSSMNIIREVRKGEKISDLVSLLQNRTLTTGVEHAVVKLGKNSVAPGVRVIVSGGPHGISFGAGEVKTIFGHTHPFVTGASTADFKALQILNQSRQYIIEGFNSPFMIRKP